MTKAFVVAAAVTFRRPRELERLLRGLAASGESLGAVVIVDNASEKATQELTEEILDSDLQDRKIPWSYVPAENLGPGGGWKRGMEEALARFENRVTHLWTLDDDVVIEPGVLDRLLAGMKQAEAEVAAPLVCDEAGLIGDLGVPEPIDVRQRRLIRQVKTRDNLREVLGIEPLEICWCIGPCVLVSRRAVEEAGMHRPDFWLLGEDIEYGLRLSSKVRCVAIPTVVVPHIPPRPTEDGMASRSHYLRFCSLLQNLSYIALRLRYSRHLWRYLPGNFRRFFGTFGWSGETLRDAVYCFWHGAVLGHPAGHESGGLLRRRISDRTAAHWLRKEAVR